MNSVWYSLIWKEWREHRGWIATLAGAAVLLAPLPVLGELGHRWPGYVWAAAIITVPMISLFLGAGIAASEQSQRTISFLQSMPASTTRPAIAKLLLALITVWAPCVVFLGVLQFWYWQGEDPNKVIAMDWAVVAYGLAASSLLIWMAAAGVNLSDEVRAGAVGLLVILLCLGALALVVDRPWINDAFENALLVAAPAGPAIIFEKLFVARQERFAYGPIWPLFLASIVSHGALAAWYVARFGRVIPARTQAIEAAPRFKPVTWLAPPRKRPWTAILWKQMRETFPLAALGAGAILCLSVMFAVAHRGYTGEQIPPGNFAQGAAGIWIMTGFCVSVVAGIGLFLDDLRPGLHTFWRSRPINADQWFAVKFIPALLMTALTLALPAVLVCGWALMISWRDGEVTKHELQESSQLFGASLLVQVAAFCIAAAMMALVRRPVYAALLTALTMICIAIGFEGATLTTSAAATIVAAFAMAAAIVAWLAVRNDWAWNP